MVHASKISDQGRSASRDRAAHLSRTVLVEASPDVRLASPKQKKRAVVICGMIALLTGLFVPVASEHWPRIVAFLPAYQTVVIIAYAITGYLVFAQYRVCHSLALLYLSGGCFYTSAILIA